MKNAIKLYARLEKNYTPLTEVAQARIKDALVKYYYHGDVQGKYNDLQSHLILRLEEDRKSVIPWIDHHHKLHGSELLEIGSGTGASTLAYAEQGAGVTGLDIKENSLKVAEIRCNTYGYSPRLIVGNAVDIDSYLPDKRFNIAVFHASLEHMTFHERIASLRAVWKKLMEGGILVIADTPNRLWHTDRHTSLLPFYHWLPDEVAFEYSRFSPRKGFGDIYDNWGEQMFHFLRRGRGVSFHEFEIAFDGMQNMRAGKSLHEFWMACTNDSSGDVSRPLLRRALSLLRRSFRNMLRYVIKYEKRTDFSADLYVDYLKSLKPGLSDGFFREDLFLIFSKD